MIDDQSIRTSVEESTLMQQNGAAPIVTYTSPDPLVRRSSNMVDEGMAQDARRALGTAPDPGLRAGV